MKLGKGQRKVAAWAGKRCQKMSVFSGQKKCLEGRSEGVQRGFLSRTKGEVIHLALEKAWELTVENLVGRILETVYQHRRMCTTEGSRRDKKEQCSAVLKRLVLKPVLNWANVSSRT